MGDIVQLSDIPPRKINRTYQGQQIVITYTPAIKKWKWEVLYVHKSRFSGEAATRQAAVKEAEQFIDKTNKIRSKDGRHS